MADDPLLLIPKSLVEEIGTYLTHRPYREVALWVPRLMTLQPAEIPAEKPTDG